MFVEIHIRQLKKGNKMKKNIIDKRHYLRLNKPLVALLSGVLATYSVNSSAVTFSDIATQVDAGIDYRRVESPIDALWDPIRQGLFFFEDLPSSPGATRGAPGVALLDFDNDGDLDIYVTNGPGVANSLYANQLKETGQLSYVDVGASSGAGAIEQDSSGVCFGDIDNDGDDDILVLGVNESNRLFKNNGDKTFEDISISSTIGNGIHNPSSCTMGDINNDGLLDIYIGNSYNNWSHRLPIMLFGFENLIESNQLFLNAGNNVFTDVSETSGILTQKEITWAVAMVDYDQDGDLDIISADDQGGKLPTKFGGLDVGFIRIYNNDGSGQFSDVTASSGTMQYGAWMGLAFGDLNADGNMDMFASNLGDYSGLFVGGALGIPYVLGDWSSSWYLGNADNQFTRASAGALVATPFGWGADITDYDNDGDADIVYHGGADFATYQDGSNPGAMLLNDGAANFTYDALALSQSTNHTRRNVRGVVMGDLNNDGFSDIVSVSAQNWPQFAPLVPMLPFPVGSPFDASATLWPAFFPLDATNPAAGFVWSGIDPEDGTLSVEINSADNNNQWIKIKMLGTKGITEKGSVNRNGIGSIIKFTPQDGQTAMLPVVGGSSYASQSSLEKTFGLGVEDHGTIDILWPGGVRNKLYYAHASDNILFPEIPCSYADESLNPHEYSHCVLSSLKQIKHQGFIDYSQFYHFYFSALKAYHDYREL